MDTGNEETLRRYALDYLTYHSGLRQKSFRLFASIALGWGGLLAFLTWQGANAWIMVPLGGVLIVLSVLFWHLEKAWMASVRDAEEALQFLNAQHIFAKGDDAKNVPRLFKTGAAGVKQVGATGVLHVIQGIYPLFAVLGLYFAVLPFLRGKVPGWEVRRQVSGTARTVKATPSAKTTPRPLSPRPGAATPRILVYPPGMTPSPEMLPPRYPMPATGATPARSGGTPGISPTGTPRPQMPMPFASPATPVSIPSGAKGAPAPVASPPPTTTPAPPREP